MEKVKHTLGPWEIKPGNCPGADGFTGPTIHGNHGDSEWVVAVLDSGNQDDAERDDIWQASEKMTAANARLIAAAPTLLAACEAVLEVLVVDDGLMSIDMARRLVMQLSAAIAAADPSRTAEVKP